MHRLLFCFSALVWLTLPAQAQDQQPPRDAARSAGTGQYDQVKRSEPLPPESIPIWRLRSYSNYDLDENDLGVLTDTLSEVQILRRLSRLYQYQAEILAAQANEDIEHAEGLLALAMSEIGTLTQQPEIIERPRFRELYRSLVTEYERYYGVTDASLDMPSSSVFQLRADVFAMIDEVEEPLLEDVSMPRLAPFETVVPMTTNRVVEQTVKYFVEKKRDLLVRWMGRADTYFPMVEQIFREEGVPDELKYMALVESGLVPTAQSWARAVGMWQFIAPTGGAYGLRVSSWVDERMDPEKATRAAARHLKDLYKMYGNNWHVAMAGYNCSPRCIKRAIRKAGGSMDNVPSYWEIYPYLPRETRGYVPQFIAFALIMSSPSDFGLTDVPPGPRYAYDLVPVNGMISLKDVAEMAGTDEATIKALNPELRRGSLPPSQSAYMLRIPQGSYEQFASAFEALPAESKRPLTEYVVRRGDSLGKIGTKYGVSVAALKSANNLRSTTVHPGQRLIVPVPSYRGTVTLADARPISVAYGARAIRPIEPERTLVVNTQPQAPPVVRASETSTAPKRTSSSSGSSTTSASSSTQTRIVYKVRRGDTLSNIAGKYGVKVRDIQKWNSLSSTRIKTGQRLTVYPGQSAPSHEIYKVRRGDTLSKIAGKYGTSVSKIKQANNLQGSNIRVGQNLIIHPGQTTPSYTVYRVRRGDNLGKIAQRYGTSVSKIKEWNSLRSSTIRPGQRLRIYS